MPTTVPPALEPLMQMTLDLNATDLGTTPAGVRNEVSLQGAATSSHWPGDWPVTGIDHLVVGTDGIARLDVHGVVGTGSDVFAYRGTGRAGSDGIVEGIVFETASEQLTWLNGAVAIGIGTLRDGALVIDVFEVSRAASQP